MEKSNYKNENIEIKQLNTWYDWLINYILEPMRKIVGDFKDKVVSNFKKTHLKIMVNKSCMREERN